MINCYKLLVPLFYQGKHHEVTHDIYNTSKKIQRGFTRYSKSKCYNSTMIALGQIRSEKIILP